MKTKLIKALRFICFTYVIIFGFTMILGMGNSQDAGCRKTDDPSQLPPAPPDTTPPAAPTNLVVITVSATKIDLSWEEPTDEVDLSGYAIYRDGIYLRNINYERTSISDEGLNPETKYCYEVLAFDTSGNRSDKSNQACATTLPDTTPPTTPTDLSAISGVSDQIDIEWNDSVDDINVEGYNIFRDGLFLESVNQTSFSDVTINKGDRYCYTVSAFDAAGNESDQSPKACAITWTVTTIEESPGGTWGTITSMALDSADNLHLTYNWNDSLQYATNVTGTWVIETVDNLSSVGRSCSIALDSNDNVHLSYHDENNEDLRYATNATGIWTTEIIDNEGNRWGYSSIAIDTGDNIHISYDGNSDLKYANNVSGAWNIETIDSGGYISWPSSLIIDSADKVHISHIRDSNLWYITNASGSWVSEIIDESGSGFKNFSISIDSQNKLHLVHKYVTDLYYATNATGIWINEMIYSQETVGDGCSLAIDSADNMHVSFYDMVAGKHDLFYATNSFGDWEAYEIYRPTTHVKSTTSIAVDSTDKVHIVFLTDGYDIRYAVNK